MKKLISSFIVLLLFVGFSVRSHAVEGDLFVQVDLNGLDPDGCSIMQITPAGVISEFISNAQILAATGETTADCDDTGLAVGLDGTVFFNEDESDDILMATNPGGVLSVFVTEAAIIAAAGGSGDIDNGMAISPVNGNLYVADEGADSILMVNVGGFNPGLVTLIITEADFEALLPPGDSPDLEGGIAIDFAGNIYISDDANDLIYKYEAATDTLSILSTAVQIAAATGTFDIDLDVGVVFGGDLFVLDDGGCDCLLRVNPNNGNASAFITEANIISATGGDFADVEGGLAIDENQNLYIGDDGDLDGDEDRPNIVQATQLIQTSLFASATDIRDFYNVAEPGGDPRLEGSMAIEGIFDFPPLQVPTLSEWGMIATALGLGIIGFIVARRRMVNA